MLFISGSVVVVSGKIIACNAKGAMDVGHGVHLFIHSAQVAQCIDILCLVGRLGGDGAEQMIASIGHLYGSLRIGTILFSEFLGHLTAQRFSKFLSQFCCLASHCSILSLSANRKSMSSYAFIRQCFL